MKNFILILMVLCSISFAQNHKPKQSSFVANIEGTVCQFDFVPYCGNSCTAYDYRKDGSDWTSFELTYKCKSKPKRAIVITFYDRNDFITQNTYAVGMGWKEQTDEETVYIHNQDSYFMLNDGIKRTILHNDKDELNNEFNKSLVTADTAHSYMCKYDKEWICEKLGTKNDPLGIFYNEEN